jgi:hypothetical protein
LIRWLGHDAQAASVLATAQLHIKLRALVEQALPATMRGAFEVLKIERGTLTLTVSSAAFAAKFRQLAPRVTSHIQAAGWNLLEIKLRVQGGLGIPAAVTPKKEARALDQQDLKTFEALTHKLRPGPLADAVARLLAHHQPTHAQGLKQASIHGETPTAPEQQTRK